MASPSSHRPPSGEPPKNSPHANWWESPLARKVGAVSLAVTLGLVAFWWFSIHPYVSTDDARVSADLIRIAPDGVEGKLIQVNVLEGDRVTQGEVLAELDHTMYQAQLLRAQAQANLTMANAVRAQRLFKQSALSEQELQAAEAASQSAQAELQVAQTNLDNTYLKSPVAGVVVQKIAVPGNILEAGQVALVVADIDHAWVSANIEETSVGLVRIGQPVQIKVDEGGRLTGKVSEITDASASQFALIPAENASGNYIKLVQRIPIKVVLDDHPDRVLKAGQSVEIKIKVR
jgi:RND family efflux transporter MFP subunit